MRKKPDSRHDLVFCPATLKLGEIHWYLLRAASLMEARTTVKTEVEGAAGVHLVSPELTDFGKEVGRDEINWWVFRKETSVDELRARSQRALDAAQALKRGAQALKHSHPQSCAELLEPLRRFAENHMTEIDALHEYVQWLSARDLMAPKILFTYRVWGSTKRADRWIDVDAKTPEEESPDRIRHFTEIVLGLRSSILTALDRCASPQFYPLRKWRDSLSPQRENPELDQELP
jgi:hypothetical protein